MNTKILKSAGLLAMVFTMISFTTNPIKKKTLNTKESKIEWEGEKLTGSHEGDAYGIIADLTIKGKTNPVTFDLEMNGDTATADLTIDRTKYDVKYGSGSIFDGLGDKVIYDEFKLDVKLKF